MPEIFQKRGKGYFESEAEGLRLMSLANESGCGEGEEGLLKIPKVYFAKDNVGLDIEKLKDLHSASINNKHHLVRLARGLCHIHNWIDPNRRATTAHTTFGFHLKGQCGALAHPNNEQGIQMSWIDFFRDFRLDYQLGLVKTEYPHQTNIIELGAKLSKHLNELFDGHGLRQDEIRPSLLHGDLWSGNWGVSQGKVCVFDPAPFYGHFEFEFGIGTMFGGPVCKTFLDAYFDDNNNNNGGEAMYPPGFDDRLKLYALYHHLNHLNIFGESYAGGTQGLLQQLTSKKVLGVL